MIFDSRTGKIIVTKEQLIKDAKEYFNSMSIKELRARVNKEKRRIKEKLTHRR